MCRKACFIRVKSLGTNGNLIILVNAKAVSCSACMLGGTS